MCFHITHLSFYFGFLMHTIFGLLPFMVIFFLVEVLKISLHLAVAVFNFSMITQISYILNFEWVTRYDDKVRINKGRSITFQKSHNRIYRVSHKKLSSSVFVDNFYKTSPFRLFKDSFEICRILQEYFQVRSQKIFFPKVTPGV